MAHAKINDIDMYYEIHGDGPPLVLIEGFGLNHLSWQAYIEPLATRFQVIVFDNRGVGKTAAPHGPYTIEQMADDTAALLNHLKLPKAHILGLSMGTLITQQLCLSHPELVEKVVLLAPFSHLPENSKHLLKSGATNIENIDYLIPWLLSNQAFATPGACEQFIDAIEKDPFPQTPEGRAGQANALCSCDLRNDIHKIEKEVLLLVGEKDVLTPKYCADYIQKEIAGAKMHIFKDQAHAFQVEIPGLVIEKTLEFLTL